MTTHTYAATLTWEGSTGAGYEHYDRAHEVVPEGAPGLRLSADPAFRGDASLANPEALLLAAASSCQLLSFLAVAARARIDVVAYTDAATARMPEDDLPVRITEIVLRPCITVRSGHDPDAVERRVRRLVALAHDQCYIANTLRCPVRIEASVVMQAD